MQFFALETSIEKIRKRYMDPGDQLILTTQFHPLKFWLSVLWQVLIGIVLITLAVLAYEYTPITLEWDIGVTAVLFIPFVLWPVLKRYVEWRYDFIDVLADKVIIVDQGTIFRQTVKQINLENFASVEAETQLLNLFPFGRVRFSLKEGEGAAILLNFIPNASDVADTIADAVSNYHRRRELHHTAPAATTPAAPAIAPEQK